jgi:hypothetical protein
MTTDDARTRRLRALEAKWREISSRPNRPTGFLICADELEAVLDTEGDRQVHKKPKHGPFPNCSTCGFPIDGAGFCSAKCAGGDGVMTPCTCVECRDDRPILIPGVTHDIDGQEWKPRADTEGDRQEHSGTVFQDLEDAKKEIAILNAQVEGWDYIKGRIELVLGTYPREHDSWHANIIAAIQALQSPRANTEGDRQEPEQRCDLCDQPMLEVVCGDCMTERSVAEGDASPAPRCNSDCNPYRSPCGATFCTYEDMAAHIKQEHPGAFVALPDPPVQP